MEPLLGTDGSWWLYLTTRIVKLFLKANVVVRGSKGPYTKLDGVGLLGESLSATPPQSCPRPGR
jgi:hypothetical protein